MLTLRFTEGAKVSFKSHHGRYLTTYENGHVAFDGEKVGLDQVFTIVKKGDSLYSLLSRTGRYISVTEDKKLICVNAFPFESCTFHISILDEHTAQIKSNKTSKYVCAERDHRAVVDRERAAEWETFEITFYK